MKLMKILFIGIICCLFLSSCASVYKSPTGTAPLGISLNVVSLDADIQVDMTQKLRGTATGIYWLGVLKLSGDSSHLEGYGEGAFGLGKTKSAAAFNALDDTDYDVLVSPTFIVHRKIWPLLYFGFVSYEVEVVSYGGKIKNIK